MDVFTQYAYNDSFYDNGTWNFNETHQEQRHPYNYYAMLLTLLIFIIVFGNVLVCMAVSREKALQTTTNYLIVSLAVADLLVATLVMPWVVYLEVGWNTDNKQEHGIMLNESCPLITNNMMNIGYLYKFRSSK